MIIDFHAHTSNHSMRNMHTTSATIATLEAYARQYGITKIILLATYFPHKKSGVHNYDMLERIKGNPLFQMFGSLDALNHPESGLAELRVLAEAGKMAGIKLYPGYQEFHASDPRLGGIYDLAEEYRLPVMLHGGEVHNCDKKLGELAHPRFVEKPAREHPTVKFVVSHLANPYFEELRKVMEQCSNVFTDMSGQFVSGSAEDTEEYRKLIVEEIKEFIARLGSRRILFATDFPIQSYADSLDLINRLKLTGEDLRNVLSDNALRILDKNHIP